MKKSVKRKRDRGRRGSRRGGGDLGSSKVESERALADDQVAVLRDLSVAQVIQRAKRQCRKADRDEGLTG
jgi:hypothetical protein